MNFASYWMRTCKLLLLAAGSILQAKPKEGLRDKKSAGRELFKRNRA